MRLSWKIVLIAAIPLGGYWLYKKSSRPTEIKEQPGTTEEKETTSKSPPQSGAEKRSDAGSTEQIIEQLTEIDGVTSRVAENLVDKGIKSKEALVELSEEELRSVKGIGPKRAAKILELK
ncbi:Helix-hairpin-helix domain-containing protein [Fodinibius salinus]|uniref:Helix-hairpin-helix domain-containing protein n=1 Tax=Fodinibius salinus TaxID=860790 RepID=A0A5D3YIT4_9BACT|nr:helix-hairpin-helix domain-containing protein [Fodinibius salinus]TYP93350.1 Helix-hairpin-helix domain-containing protein [Fodinibius salinus]